MNQQKVNKTVLVVVSAVVGWVAGNLWEGRRTDRLCDTAYELLGVAELNSRGQARMEDQLARECDPAELSSTRD